MSDENFATGYAVGRDSGSGYGNSWGEWIWIIIILAMFGYGGYGGGFGFGGRGGMSGVATQADLSAGFANNEIMSDLNDIILQNSQNTAAIQQTLCQGFSGVNQSLERGLATTNYNMATGFTGVTSAIDKCCCEQAKIALENRYLNERQTCDLITNNNANTQRILDYLCSEKISALQSENAALKGQISNNAQSAYIVSQLRQPCPVPAYVVPNPNCCYPTGCTSVQ
jgi:hypothetical protein